MTYIPYNDWNNINEEKKNNIQQSRIYQPISDIFMFMTRPQRIDNINIDSIIRELINSTFDIPLSDEKNENLNLELEELENTSTKTCTICVDDIEIGEKYYNLECNHHFHTQCIKNWYQYKQECPVCRHRIEN